VKRNGNIALCKTFANAFCEYPFETKYILCDVHFSDILWKLHHTLLSFTLTVLSLAALIALRNLLNWSK